jgi:hypothetical protein
VKSVYSPRGVQSGGLEGKANQRASVMREAASLRAFRHPTRPAISSVPLNDKQKAEGGVRLPV